MIKVYYLANYLRHVSSYLALHLLIVSNTLVAFATAELPANQGYRIMLANTTWPDDLPLTVYGQNGDRT